MNGGGTKCCDIFSVENIGYSWKLLSVPTRHYLNWNRTKFSVGSTVYFLFIVLVWLQVGLSWWKKYWSNITLRRNWVVYYHKSSKWSIKKLGEGLAIKFHGYAYNVTTGKEEVREHPQEKGSKFVEKIASFAKKILRLKGMQPEEETHTGPVTVLRFEGSLFWYYFDEIDVNKFLYHILFYWNTDNITQHICYFLLNFDAMYINFDITHQSYIF